MVCGVYNIKDVTNIVKDFDNYIKYLETNDILLTKTKEYVSRKDLKVINELMANPWEKATKGSEQNYYPLLHLFYHLCIDGKLFKKTPAKGGKLSLEGNKELDMYKKLTDTAKYIFMLKTLWIDVDWKEADSLGDKGFGITPDVMKILQYISDSKPGAPVVIHSEVMIGRLDISIKRWNYFHLYFSYLGIWNVEEDGDRRYSMKKRFDAKIITPTAFGVDLAKRLLSIPIINWNLPWRRSMGDFGAIPGSKLPNEVEFFVDDRECKESKLQNNNDDEDIFVRELSDLFPKGELNKLLPRAKRGNAGGNYIFKVSLSGKLWRKIKISSKATFLDLHDMIQKAFNFDDDHLYAFYMDGKLYSDYCFVSPFDSNGIGVDEVKIGEVGLYEGQKIKYLFDFGDSWVFDIKIEKVNSEEPEISSPEIISEKGKAPEQYPEY